MSSKFGEYLRKLRTDRGMTLRQVQEIAHISNGYLSQLENGQRTFPNPKVLSRLADCYGVSAETIARRVVELTHEEAHEKLQPDSMVPAPTIEFLSRGYEKLSEEGKKHLKEYLQFLVEKELKKGEDGK